MLQSLYKLKKRLLTLLVSLYQTKNKWYSDNYFFMIIYIIFITGP